MVIFFRLFRAKKKNVGKKRRKILPRKPSIISGFKCLSAMLNMYAVGGGMRLMVLLRSPFCCFSAHFSQLWGISCVHTLNKKETCKKWFQSAFFPLSLSFSPKEEEKRDSIPCVATFKKALSIVCAHLCQQFAVILAFLKPVPSSRQLLNLFFFVCFCAICPKKRLFILLTKKISKITFFFLRREKKPTSQQKITTSSPADKKYGSTLPTN